MHGAYSKELPKKVALKDLKDENPRVARRIGSYFKANRVGSGRFSHYRPAAYLQRDQGTLLSQTDEPTVERANEMFKVLNGLLS